MGKGWLFWGLKPAQDKVTSLCACNGPISPQCWTSNQFISLCKCSFSLGVCVHKKEERRWRWDLKASVETHIQPQGLSCQVKRAQASNAPFIKTFRNMTCRDSELMCICLVHCRLLGGRGCHRSLMIMRGTSSPSHIPGPHSGQRTYSATYWF